MINNFSSNNPISRSQDDSMDIDEAISLQQEKLNDNDNDIRDFFCSIIKEFKLNRDVLGKKLAFIVVVHMVDDLKNFLCALESIGNIVAIIPKGSAVIEISNWAKKKYKQIFKEDITKAELQKSNFAVEFIREIIKNFPEDKKLIIFDIGGYFAPRLQEISENRLIQSKLIGIIEDTKNGHVSFHHVIKSSLSQYPIVSIAENILKNCAEDQHVGEAIVDATAMILKTQANTILRDMSVVGVIGYGNIGKSVANCLRARRIREILVYDQAATAQLKAVSDGFKVVPNKNQLLRQSDLIFCNTGNFSLTHEDFLKLESGVIIASCTSSDKEFDFESLKELTQGKPITTPDGLLTTRHLNGGVKIKLIRDGDAANFAYGSQYGTWILTTQAGLFVSIKKILELSETHENLNKLYKLSKECSEKIAKIWMRHFNDKKEVQKPLEPLDYFKTLSKEYHYKISAKLQKFLNMQLYDIGEISESLQNNNLLILHSQSELANQLMVLEYLKTQNADYKYIFIQYPEIGQNESNDLKELLFENYPILIIIDHADTLLCEEITPLLTVKNKNLMLLCHETITPTNKSKLKIFSVPVFKTEQLEKIIAKNHDSQITLYGRNCILSDLFAKYQKLFYSRFANADLLHNLLLDSNKPISQEQENSDLFFIEPILTQEVKLYDLFGILKSNSNLVLQVGISVNFDEKSLFYGNRVYNNLQDIKTKLQANNENRETMYIYSIAECCLDDEIKTLISQQQGNVVIFSHENFYIDDLANSYHLKIEDMQSEKALCSKQGSTKQLTLPTSITKQKLHEFANLSQLLESKHRIVILADSGLGKTRICQRLCEQWKESNNLLSGYNGVFAVDLTTITNQDLDIWNLAQPPQDKVVFLMQLLQRKVQVLNNIPEWEKQFLKFDLEHENILLILDAWDELKNNAQIRNNQVHGIIHKLFSYKNIVVTARKYVNLALIPEPYITLFIEPFDSHRIKQFLQYYGLSLPKFQPKELDLLKIPLHLKLYCESSSTNLSQIDNDASNQIKLYETFICHKLKIYLSREKRCKVNHEYVSSLCHDELVAISQIAFSTAGFNYEEIDREKEVMDEELISKLLKIGIVTKIRDTWKFYHAIFKEYFIALYIVRGLCSRTKSKAEKFTALVKKYRYISQYMNIWPFVLNILWSSNTRLLKRKSESLKNFLDAIFLDPIDILGSRHLILVYKCFNGIDLSAFPIKCSNFKEKVKQCLEHYNQVNSTTKPTSFQTSEVTVQTQILTAKQNPLVVGRVLVLIKHNINIISGAHYHIQDVIWDPISKLLNLKISALKEQTIQKLLDIASNTYYDITAAIISFRLSRNNANYFSLPLIKKIVNLLNSNYSSAQDCAKKALINIAHKINDKLALEKLILDESHKFDKHKLLFIQMLYLLKPKNRKYLSILVEHINKEAYWLNVCQVIKILKKTVDTIPQDFVPQLINRLFKEIILYRFNETSPSEYAFSLIERLLEVGKIKIDDIINNLIKSLINKDVRPQIIGLLRYYNKLNNKIVNALLNTYQESIWGNTWWGNTWFNQVAFVKAIAELPQDLITFEIIDQFVNFYTKELLNYYKNIIAKFNFRLLQYCVSQFCSIDENQKKGYLRILLQYAKIHKLAVVQTSNSQIVIHTNEGVLPLVEENAHQKEQLVEWVKNYFLQHCDSEISQQNANLQTAYKTAYKNVSGKIPKRKRRIAYDSQHHRKCTKIKKVSSSAMALSPSLPDPKVSLSQSQNTFFSAGYNQQSESKNSRATNQETFYQDEIIRAKERSLKLQSNNGNIN